MENAWIRRLAGERESAKRAKDANETGWTPKVSGAGRIGQDGDRRSDAAEGKGDRVVGCEMRKREDANETGWDGMVTSRHGRSEKEEAGPGGPAWFNKIGDGQRLVTTQRSAYR